MNTIFRLVNPVVDRNMCIFKVSLFIKRAKLQYFILRSACSTCRAATLGGVFFRMEAGVNPNRHCYIL